MKKLTSTEIRNMWYSYFQSKGHTVMESAPLIPMDDDSLLFTNAGVTPLKKYFDGTIVPKNKRIATIQKCIRTNDIENVGVTKRHLTFFEMMGNFSIGDYFKEEALAFAYEFLTSEEYAAIPKEKIYVTIYTKDDVAFNRWKELGLDEDHIVRLEGNFWEIGEGPCGPDSEIFYDRGEKYDKDGKALEHFKNDEDQERYIEIWNNVFSQYNSRIGVPREEYQELPHKNIDTGAGLERWCCVFQDVDSTFDTDLFVPIIKRIEELSGKEYAQDMPFKVIADHIRAITLALSDGAIFENTGRGYVLRRLLRRSVRMGKKLGLTEPFMYKLVDTVVAIMGESYKELNDTQALVKTLILQEEELFHKTLFAGERKLMQLIEESTDKTISGHDAFRLYDTYGFPFELTLEYLEEVGFTTSREEFDKYMQEARKLAKDNRKTEASMNIQNEELLAFTKESEFLYDTYEIENAKVIGLIQEDGKFTEKLENNGYVILDKTCFYAESGGQVSDTGAMKNDSFKVKVVDVKKAPNGQHLHKVELLEGIIKLNDTCIIKIHDERRKKIARNHSSVHIIQKVLQNILSKNIHQAGSYVDENRLRFDFTYTGKISDNDIIAIEEKVNDIVHKNLSSFIQEMPLEDAKRIGAMALFSEKYKDVVRVVTIGESIELCGGTHIKNTKEIENIAILKIESKGSNVYRLEAATNEMIPVLISEVVAHYVDEVKKLLVKAHNIIENAKNEGINLTFDIDLDQEGLNSYKAVLYNKNQLEYVQTEVRELEKKYKEEKTKQKTSDLSYYLDKKEERNGINCIITTVENEEVSELKEIMDQLFVKIQKGFIFIANVKGETINFLCKSNIDTLNAGLLVKRASQMSNGNGGGSATFAQGGGKTKEALDEILRSIKNEVEK